MDNKNVTWKYPKTQPLPIYKREFDSLSESCQIVIIHIQQKYKGYWWNPYCKTVCLGHNKVHKYSFESYVEGWVKGYFGFDTIKEMVKDLNKK